MNIAGVEVGGSAPCRIVAEISNAHNGDRDRCGRLIDAAKAVGADFVKLQCYTADELVALRGDGPAPEPWQRYTMRELYTKAQTPLEWFPKIRDHCERVGIPWFSSVFGAESLAVLEAVNCPCYKISHFECDNDALALLVRATKKPVVVSQPYALGKVSTHYWKGDVIRLLCPGGYPASPDEMLLGRRFLWEPWGLSNHCRDPLVPVVAVARGAAMIEMHFHLEAEPSELEANVSLNEREFAAMVQSVRAAERILS